jgi:hypothetical protein
VTDQTMTPPVPVPDPDTAGYWRATAEGKLMLCRDVETGEWIHPPLERSRTGNATTFEEVSGRGTIYSFIVVRQQLVPVREVPYVVGVIELDEQPGLRLTGVILADPVDVVAGLPVQARIAPFGSGEFQAPEFDLITN